MNTFLLLVLAQAQAPPPAASAEPAPVVEPWSGSLAEGLAEMKRLAEAAMTDEALAVAERLIAPDAFARWRESTTSQPGWKRTAALAAGPILGAVGLAEWTDAERAAVQHARGVVLAASTDGKRFAAVDAFERARALAGPGSLRLDATYDAGWTWLAEGEAMRAKIPEISGAPAQAAAAPTTPGGASPGAPPEADPLELARSAYLRASERFVDRVKLEPSDANTRANLELVHRRLRELQEIQRKRKEEEKKKQEEQQKDQDSQDPEKPEKKDESQKKDDEKEDPDSKPDEEPDPAEKKPDAKPPKDPEAEPEEPLDPSDAKDPKKAEKPQPAREELLTREEVMRLLDILKDREEEGQKLLEQLRAARRVTVKKDW